MRSKRDLSRDKQLMSSVMFPRKHLAFISLSLGFLVIWTSVIAAVLLSNTFTDDSSANQSFQVFRTHKQISKIVFSIGHEMVATVDWLLSVSKDKQQLSVEDAIAITWKMTDLVIVDIKQQINDMKMESISNLMSLVESKLSHFRANSVFVGANPVKIIHFYYDLCEIIERKCVTLDTTTATGLAKRHLPLPSTAFALFIRGMSNRLAELAFGTVYVRSDLPLNKSQYMHYHYSSQELIENAFRLNPRVENRYWELFEENPMASRVLTTLVDDMLAGSLNRWDSRFASLFISSVNNEIATLLRAKDILSGALSSQMTQLASAHHKLLAFHLSIAIIAITAVIVCLAFLCCSFRYASGQQNALFSCDFLTYDNALQRRDSIYSLEYNDKSKILRRVNYDKQLF